MDKIGLHIVEGFGGNLGKPRVVKLVDVSTAYVAQVREQVGPDCLIIVRWYEQSQPLDAGSAVAWFGRRLAVMRDMNAYGPVAFEGYNEIADSEAAAYCAFEIDRLRLMHAEGLHAVVGNFSVGTPDLPVWQTYKPMLDAMDGGDYLGLHEYWADHDDLSNHWHCGRWRLLPQLDGIPIVVTECGRDVVEGRGKAGWRKTCNADQFLADLRAYNAILMQQDRVKGACVFGGGRIYSDWTAFDVNDIWPRVVAEYSARPDNPPPAPEPEPQPTIGIPLIDEVRMAIKNTHKAWYEASVFYGRYDGHPERAQDWNLETGGNTDLGEPLVAPFNGIVVQAANYGGGYGRIVGIVGVTQQGELIYWQGRHLHTMAVKPGQIVWCGDPIGAIGNADGYYAGAHLHEQICTGEVPGATQSWQAARYNFVQPSQFYVEHGVDPALVERMRKHDGK